MGKKNFITLSTVLIFSSNIYAGSLSVKVEGQTVTAKVCSMSQGAKDVLFQISEKGYSKNGIAQPQTRMENGCAVKVYASQPTTLIQKGVEVTATYTRTDNTKWTGTAVAAGGSTPTPTPQPPKPTPPTPPVVTPRPGTPPSPTPQPNPAPTPAPAPVKKTTEDSLVRKYAEQAANFMANRVVDAYGPVENFRFWFFEGFKNDARYNNDVRRLPEFSSSLREGRHDGRQDGLRLGSEAGASAGRAQGNQEAVGRFQRAVNNPALLDTAAGELPTGEGFQGLKGDKYTPTMSQLLSEYNHVFLDEVRKAINLNNDFEDDVIQNIFGEYWSLSDYYSWENYKYDTVFSRWKAENAFELFLNRKLVRAGGDSGKINANNQMLELYRKITDAEEYSDASQSRQIYQNEFADQYNSVIRSKWRNEVYGTKNSRAYSRGVYYHDLAIREIARRAGYEEGFNPTFNEASREGYRSSIGAAYKQKFDETASYYSGHSVIDGVQFQVKNQAGQTTVAVLDSVYPIFLNATNFGKVDGAVSATLSGNGLAALPSSGELSINVPGLSRIADVRKLGAPAQISANVKPNKSITVNISIRAGEQTYIASQQLMVSWAATVKQLANESDASRTNVLSSYIVSQLQAEWKDEGGLDFSNDFEKKPMETLAGQYVQLVQSLSPAEQQKLSAYARSITDVYGKKPRLFNKGKWIAVENLFKRLNYPMPK